MADELVLRIDPDGTVSFLSGSGVEEALDMRAIGPMRAERAGHIQFDAFSQTWAWSAAPATGDGFGRKGFLTRREAVADEVKTLSKLL